MTKSFFPQVVFTTQRKFNDYGTCDMRYGDLSESRLKREFSLANVSDLVDPFTLTKLTAFDNPQSRFSGSYGQGHRGKSISIQDCASLLFEEMQIKSLPYSFVGSNKYLINKLLRHFQLSTGTPFSDPQLNFAYTNKIINDNSLNGVKNSIYQEIDEHVDYSNYFYPQDRIPELGKIISSRTLPKFDSPLLDKINGMGVSIHDIHATKIEILYLNVDSKGWNARIKFIGQDHFGLDNEDIRKKKFKQFQFFKIWFILQHYDKFGFRPFFTNMEAIIDLRGIKS